MQFPKEKEKTNAPFQALNCKGEHPHTTPPPPPPPPTNHRPPSIGTTAGAPGGGGRRAAVGKGSRSASRHQQFRDRAKTRVDDLQEMFSGLQSARKESRSADAALLEEQVHHMLREWHAELSIPSPASSLQGNNRESSNPPSGTLRLLQPAAAEEEDDATSKLVELPPPPPAANQGHGHSQNSQDLKPMEPREETAASAVAPSAAQQSPGQGAQGDGGGADAATAMFHDQMYYLDQELSVEDLFCDLPGPNPDTLHHLQEIGQLDYQQFSLPHELPPDMCLDMNNCGNNRDVFIHTSDLLTTICPSPSAFLRPKCALWDCNRPAQESERCQDYCSIYHADLALKEEGPPGTMPVIRPRGIDLKDGPLFSALSAKVDGKNVGIPVCEGAATAKSPWNAPELFDLTILEGESIREWLFFDKPRRAFESGNRKQRSLPDYSGRGWHESRKQVMKNFGGLKRSYYMDPQPSSNYEWHLYEYEINDCDAFALYRLEFKSSDAKKSAKSKLATNSLNEIQRQMVRLSADSPVENKRTARSRPKASQKDSSTNMYSTPNATNQSSVPNAYQAVSQVDQMTFLNGNAVYGPHLPYGYSTERSDFYWNSSDGS